MFARDNKCAECDNKTLGTEGLQYELRNGTYTVTGIDNEKDVIAIVIPETYDNLPVTAIEDAFTCCLNLRSITIPSSVTSFDCWFSLNRKLVEIIVAENNANYCDIDGVLFTKDKKKLLRYPPGKEDAIYRIPNGVAIIGEYAFYFCEYISCIIIHSEVANIDYKNAFGFCQSLVVINVDEINEYYCDIDGVLFSKDKTQLIKYPAGRRATYYKVPSTVTVIAENAFKDSCSLANIILPDNLENVGERAFSGCNALASITIPNSVESIGEGAFDACNSLTNITIPNSVTFIESSAFQFCESLEKITVDARNANYCDIDGVLFSKDKTQLIIYPLGKTDVSYEIPDSVTIIGNLAFEFASSTLASVVMPKNIISIEYCAIFKLKIIYYCGTESDWEAITKNGDNESTVCYYSATKPLEKGNYWHYVNGVATQWE